MRIIGIAAYVSFAFFCNQEPSLAKLGFSNLLKDARLLPRLAGPHLRSVRARWKECRSMGSLIRRLLIFLDETLSQRIYMKLNAIWTTALRFD